MAKLYKTTRLFEEAGTPPTTNLDKYIEGDRYINTSNPSDTYEFINGSWVLLAGGVQGTSPVVAGNLPAYDNVSGLLISDSGLSALEVYAAVQDLIPVVDLTTQGGGAPLNQVFNDAVTAHGLNKLIKWITPLGEGVGSTTALGVEIVISTTNPTTGNLDTAVMHLDYDPNNLNADMVTSYQFLSEIGNSTSGLFAFDYKFKNDAGTTPPEKFLQFDNADETLATKIYVNKIDRGGNDMSLFLNVINTGDFFNLYEHDDINNNYSYDVTGTAVLNGNIYEIPVVYYASSPVGTISNGDRVSILWKQPSSSGGGDVYTDRENVFTELQHIDNISKVKLRFKTNSIVDAQIESSVGNIFLTVSDNNVHSSLRYSLGTKTLTGGNDFSLGGDTQWTKWKDLWLSGFANVAGVKSAENDPTKVFATDGSIIDLPSGGASLSIPFASPEIFKENGNTAPYPTIELGDYVKKRIGSSYIEGIYTGGDITSKFSYEIWVENDFGTAPVSLPIVNGSFSSANINGWTEQAATISFEIFDGLNAVKIESGGGHTMLKQEITCVIGVKYEVKALLHDDQHSNDVGLVVYDGALQNTTIGAAQDSSILNAHTITSSSNWDNAGVIFTAISTSVTIAIREFGNNIARVNKVE